jgi:hypothetical protein
MRWRPAAPGSSTPPPLLPPPLGALAPPSRRRACRSNWARRFLLYELAAYCTWLFAFTAFTLAFQQEDWSVDFWTMVTNP